MANFDTYRWRENLEFLVKFYRFKDQLARDLKVSRVSVHHWLNDVNEPIDLCRERICDLAFQIIEEQKRPGAQDLYYDTENGYAEPE